MGIPVKIGSPSTPACLDFHSTYDVIPGGNIVDSAPLDKPLQGFPRLAPADIASDSDNAKTYFDRAENRRMYVPAYNDMQGALTARRSNADVTKVQVRLKASGYVNPWDVLFGASRPDVPLLSTELEPIP